MGPRVTAIVTTGLWVLWTLGVEVVTTEATPGHCILSHYRSMDPRALVYVKTLRDSYEEETQSWWPRNCSFRARRDPLRPSACAGLRQVARAIADARAVLSRREQRPGALATLELLVAVGRDLSACLQLIPKGRWWRSPQLTRRHPRKRRTDSPRCHEVAVVFNLLRLLTRDLRLVAHAGPCV